MKEFDFSSRTKFNIKHAGALYECECPSQERIVKFSEDVEQVKDSGSGIIEATGLLLEDCGLPLKVYKELEADQVKQIVDFITLKKS